MATASVTSSRTVPRVPTDDKDFPSEGAAFVDLDGDGVTELVQAKIDSAGQLQTRAWLNRTGRPSSRASRTAWRSQATSRTPSSRRPTRRRSREPTRTPDSKRSSVAGDDVLHDAAAGGGVGVRRGRHGDRHEVHDQLPVPTAARKRSRTRPQGFAKMREIDDRSVTAATPVTARPRNDVRQIYPYTGLPTTVHRYVGIGGVPPAGVPTSLLQ